MANEFNIKNGFITSGNSNVCATLTARKLTGGSGNTNSGTYSFIGGGQLNCAGGGYNGVSGGYKNNAVGAYSTIGGGICNNSNGGRTFVGGGVSNTASSYYTTIGGGFLNSASVTASFIGGGCKNTTTPGGYGGSMGDVIVGGFLNSTLSAYYGNGLSFIGGGASNSICGDYMVIVGGLCNTSNGVFSFIGGGSYNIASGNTSTISGGYKNIAGGTRSFIGGGFKNTASNNYATIVGGYCHVASGDTTFIGGGLCHNAGGFISTVVGGRSNSALGNYSSILGGSGNTVTGLYSSAVGFGVTASANCTFYSNNLCGTTSINSPSFSGNSDIISGTKGTVTTSGSSTTAFINVSGSNTIGGTGYTDFIRVTNTAAGATNPNKTIRVNITGGIEFLNSVYTAQTLTLTDGGVLSVGGGNIAVTSNNDPSTNYLSFNNNFTAIYDDGNTHIHSRSNGGSMWINTNNGAIILGNQSPVLGGGAASGIIMGSGSTTVRAFANIYGGKTYTIGGYGYLATIGAGTGAGTTATYGLYVQQRVEASEFDATSDERMKNIQGEIELDDAIKLVNNLKPIKFTWKDKESEGVKTGYSAQQVVKSGFNHLISHIPNEDLKETTDDEGFTSPEGFQLTMGYDQVTPYHGVVIKHLLEEIENLKKEIKELKEKVG